MTVTFYTNESPPNVMNKSITQLSSSTGTFRTQSSITDPVITVQGTLPVSANYMRITEFNRYYYITNIIAVQYDMFVVHGHTDVLMSFKDSIKNSPAIIARQENQYNLYLDDGIFKSYQNPHIKRKKFPNSPFGTFTYCLAIAGNGDSTDPDPGPGPSPDTPHELTFNDYMLDGSTGEIDQSSYAPHTRITSDFINVVAGADYVFNITTTQTSETLAWVLYYYTSSSFISHTSGWPAFTGGFTAQMPANVERLRLYLSYARDNPSGTRVYIYANQVTGTYQSY